MKTLKEGDIRNNNRATAIKAILLFSIFLFSFYGSSFAFNKGLVPLWEPQGKLINNSQGAVARQNPKLASDGKDGVIAVWEDKRLGGIDLYAQKFDKEGNIKWGKDGIVVCKAFGGQKFPVIVGDKMGGAIVAWQDYRDKVATIFAQKINNLGKPVWSNDGIKIAEIFSEQIGLKCALDETGEGFFVWHDFNPDDMILNAYIQKINKQGEPLFGNQGKLVENVYGKKTALFLGKFLTVKIDGQSQFNSLENRSFAVAPDGAIFVAWQEKRLGNYDVFIQKIGKNGNKQFAKNGKKVNSSIGSVVQKNVKAIKTGSGEAIIVFEDERSGYPNIYAQKISQDGTLLWGIDGIPLAKGVFAQESPKIAGDGQNGAIIAWLDRRNPLCTKVYLQKINSDGKILWGEKGISLTASLFPQKDFSIVVDKAGDAIIGWAETRDAKTLEDIYANKISHDGKLMWGGDGLPVCTADFSQVQPNLSEDNGGAYIVWSDSRYGDRNSDIYSQKIDSKGHLLWRKNGELVCTAPNIQRSPAVAKDDEGNAFIAWEDKGSGNFDIYAQKINKKGQILWSPDGKPVCQMTGDQRNPIVTSTGFVFWEDIRLGNWDIYYQKITEKGDMLFAKEGIPLAYLPFAEYSAQVVENEDKNLFIAWADHTGELYFQKLTIEGKPAFANSGFRINAFSKAVYPQISLSKDDNFYVFWGGEDKKGDKAIYGQEFK